VSGSLRAFADRTEAGRVLAERLAPLAASPCVVAAIPRGGVVVALPIVERLGLPLTVSYVRKLSAPAAPELAFGALDEDGEALLDQATIAALGLSAADVERIKARVAEEIRRRMERYGVPPLAAYLPASSVVLVDDGLATGLTMRAAVAYARRHGAPRIAVAAPCASAGAAAQLRAEADDLVVPVVDEGFSAVGWYYHDFSPVSDAEVLAALARTARHDPQGQVRPER
jgi:putative phosphoribosyl transferase